MNTATQIILDIALPSALTSRSSSRSVLLPATAITMFLGPFSRNSRIQLFTPLKVSYKHNNHSGQ